MEYTARSLNQSAHNYYSFNSHGDQDGTIVCQPVHGKVRRRPTSLDISQTTHVVEVHWWYLCHLGTRKRILMTFLDQINLFHPSIKFTADTSTQQVSFLDTTVMLEGDSFHTDLYTKPTDTRQYLFLDSCHPKHCTTSIPYCQALRCRSRDQIEEDFKKRTKELRTHLQVRGYQTTTVDAQIQTSSRLRRMKARSPYTHRQPTRWIPLEVTYHPGLTNL